MLSADPRYSLFNHGHLFTIQTRERAVLQALAANGYSDLRTTRVLDVGTGTGGWLRDFIRWGADPSNLFGVDRDCDRIAQAKMLCPASVTLECGDARHLNYPDGTFDIVVQSTLFSSVLEPVHRQLIANEMLRVRKREGLILWYDMRVNNPANANVRRVNRAEMKALFPQQSFMLKRLTLAPPIARRLAKRAFFPAWFSAMLLELCRPLTTHYLAVIKSAS